jgi:hypothetical protein
MAALRANGEALVADDVGAVSVAGSAIIVAVLTDIAVEDVHGSASA